MCVCICADLYVHGLSKNISNEYTQQTILNIIVALIALVVCYTHIIKSYKCYQKYCILMPLPMMMQIIILILLNLCILHHNSSVDAFTIGNQARAVSTRSRALNRLSIVYSSSSDSTVPNSSSSSISSKPAVTGSNNSNNITKSGNNDKRIGGSEGPIYRLKKAAILTILLMKLMMLKFTTTLTSLFKINKSSSNNSNKLLIAMKQLMSNRRLWTSGSLITACIYSISKYLSYVKSLTLEISFANFLKLIEMAPDRVKGLRISASSYLFLLDGKRAMTRSVSLEPSIMDRLITSGIDFAAPPAPTKVIGIIWTCAYAFFLWNISTRMMQGPADDGAGKRKDQKLASYGSLTFNDVAGQEKAKLEVKEVCDMLKAPDKFTKIGARFPSGVLLVGPPGTGKTLLARVAATEAGVPFFACSASDFVEVFVGRGPARVRKLFKQAADNSPCIVFIDELDSIGRSRRMGSMNSEQENTLNQLLTSMDGLDTSNNGVIVMGATNRYELLDPALLRSGRFDRIVQCPLPDRVGRQAILNVHTKKFSLSSNVDLEKIAKFTPGTCGADLSAICNEAAIRTVRRGGDLVSLEDFEDAMKSFYSGRGVQLSGLAEMTGLSLPNWLKQPFAAGNDPSAVGNI